MRTTVVGRRLHLPPLTLNYLVLTALLLFAVIPLVVLVFNSLKTSPEIARNPIGPPLEALRWENYPEAWVRGNYATTLRNSVVLTVGSVLGVWVVAGLAAYALARLDVFGADALTLYFLVGTSLPAQLFLVPLFVMWSRVGLTNNLFGVIIIYWATMSPFATFLLRSYMITIPRDFEDAARIDGAAEWQVLWYVIRPMTWPGFLTVGLLTALGVWNEFLFAVTFLQKPELKPIATSLYAFTSRYARDWGLTSAASVMMIAPVVIIFLLLQRRFVDGLTRGGLKG